MTENDQLRERLRAAGAEMRKRAGPAIAGGGMESWSDDMHFLLQDVWGNHVASWQPVVALAVADLLDAVVERLGKPGHREWHGPEKAAIALADAYLGVIYPPAGGERRG